MPSGMGGPPGRAPEPVPERRLFSECREGKHKDCRRSDMDDWNRTLECDCSCHAKSPQAL